MKSRRKIIPQKLDNSVELEDMLIHPPIEIEHLAQRSRGRAAKFALKPEFVRLEREKFLNEVWLRFERQLYSVIENLAASLYQTKFDLFMEGITREMSYFNHGPLEIQASYLKQTKKAFSDFLCSNLTFYVKNDSSTHLLTKNIDAIVWQAGKMKNPPPTLTATAIIKKIKDRFFGTLRLAEDILKVRFPDEYGPMFQTLIENNILNHSTYAKVIRGGKTVALDNDDELISYPNFRRSYMRHKGASHPR